MTDGQTRTDSFSLTLEDSLRFASLSGDHNPVHTDPVAARRTMFGGTAAHGIHVLLAALDRILPEQGSGALSHLSARFQAPLTQGQTATVSWERRADKFTFTLMNGQAVAQSGAFELTSGTKKSPKLDLDPFPSRLPPQQALSELEGQEGVSPLGFDHSLAVGLFPTLMDILPSWQIAAVLATTRIVGMECPGLHSLFAGLRMDFEDDQLPENLHYRVTRTDARTGYVALAVDAPGVSGVIDSFMRPAPVSQPSIGEVSEVVPKRRFEDTRALIIGGSRGLGETAAKILAAGGGDTTITWAQGKEDAVRVSAEISEAGGKCRSLHLDLSSIPEERSPSSSDIPSPNFLAFFASPPIRANSTRRWDTDLFQSYCRFYVDGLESVITAVHRWWPGAERLTVLYPSTVFVAQPEAGFAEYAAAKAAGEVAARYLDARDPVVVAHVPRLPRLRTDQTTSILPLETHHALQPLFALLEEIL